MKYRILTFLFGLLLLSTIHVNATPWTDLGLPTEPGSQWKIDDQPSPSKPGSYYLENKTQEKFNGYISAVPLFPNRTPEEDIRSRTDRFISAQKSDFSSVRYHLYYGGVPADQLIYVTRNPESRKILAWFMITNWAYNGKLYTLSLYSQNDSIQEEVDNFLISQFGDKKIQQEFFLPLR